MRLKLLRYTDVHERGWRIKPFALYEYWSWFSFWHRKLSKLPRGFSVIFNRNTYIMVLLNILPYLISRMFFLVSSVFLKVDFSSFIQKLIKRIWKIFFWYFAHFLSHLCAGKLSNWYLRKGISHNVQSGYSKLIKAVKQILMGLHNWC